MWKPGQLVTIKGIVYRVKRKIPFVMSCNVFDMILYPLGEVSTDKLPADCYLKEIKPKS